MKITVEDVHHLMLNIDAYEGPKAIKVTPRFLRYLADKYIGPCYCTTYDPNVAQDQFMGIPLEVDATIKSPFYEVVW